MTLSKSKTIFNFNHLLIIILINALALTNVDSAIVKRGINLIPTLTVDVAPTMAQLPTPFNQDSVMTYHFPIGETLNFSCIIKHPSLKYHMKILRENLLNDGTKTKPVHLIDHGSYNPNPELDLDRLTTVADQYFGTYDPQAIHLRVSVIIKELEITDTGSYKCEYLNISKEIKVVVFKQAHSKDIDFPKSDVESVNLNESNIIGCQVNKIYPKPTVSIVLPGNEQLKKSDLNQTDLFPLDDEAYFYTELTEFDFVPKYSDHNGNLTCSVLSIGTTNLTVQKSLLVNVLGFQIIPEKCSNFFTYSLNDVDAELSCVFFSNPQIEPEWSTKSTITVKSEVSKEADVQKMVTDLPKIEANLQNIGTDDLPKLETDLPKIEIDSSKLDTDLRDHQIVNEIDVKQNIEDLSVPLQFVKKVVDNAVSKIDQVIKITDQEDDSSNYVSSLEEMGNGLFKAVMKIKVVREEEFKDFTLKFTHNGVETNHVIALRKTGYNKRVKLVDNNSGTIPSYKIIHSILCITLTTLFITSNR